jgi:hypothetical protein
MNRTLIALALLTSAAAAQEDHSAQIAHMAAVCRVMMERGTCAVENAAPIPPEQRAIRWRLGRKLGVVTVGDWMDVKATGKAMCDNIATFCADYEGARCRVLRSQFPDH